MSTNQLQSRLIKHHQRGQLRTRKAVKPLDANRLLIDGIDYIDFSNNDYLALRKHPKIIEATTSAIQQFGVGSGSSALVSGYSTLHEETEQAFANWLGVDQCLLFNSGYSANIGTIGALCNREHTIYSDKLCHASLLEGIQLSRAKHKRYRHNDMKHLEHLLQTQSPDLIISESVFSMEGSIAPIDYLLDAATQHHCKLLIDDAHGIGVLGASGGGANELFKLNQQPNTCLTLPLGKTFSAMGAIVAGNATMIEAVLQFAKSYRYTTAMPPALCAAILATLTCIQQETWRHDTLINNIHFFIHYAQSKNIPLLSSDLTPVKPIVIGNEQDTMAIQAWLKAHGFFTAAIRPPTVPNNKSRLRISLNSSHTHQQIEQLLDHIAAQLKK